MKFVSIALLPLCLLAPLANAGDSLLWTDAELKNLYAKGNPTTTVDIDNDSLLLNRADGLYTSGFRLSRSYRIQSGETWRSAGWRIGQQIFTASNAQFLPDQIPPFDRPYAGWLYGGYFSVNQQADGSESALGVDIGCLGPCAGAEGTQEQFHHVLRQPQPRAWSTQIRNEAGLVLHAGGRAPYWRPSPYWDLRPGLSFRLGNIFTDLSADAVVRAGQLQSQPLSSTRYIFLRAAVRAVGYDATLQGGLFSDNDAVRTVRPKRWTGEVELGLNWQRQFWNARFSVIRRTNEIEGLAANVGRQSLIRISISWSP